MWLILCLSFIFPNSLTRPSNSGIVSLSKRQADTYIQHIQKSSHTVYNLWALTVLTHDNKTIQNYVEKNIQHRKNTSPLLTPFKEIDPDFQNQLRKVVFQAGSQNLLIALLLNIKDTEQKKALYQKFYAIYSDSTSAQINYASVCQKIISGDQITSKTLKNNRFSLPHFFLLFNKNHDIYLSEKYLKHIATKWHKSDNTRKKLTQILANITLFRTLYLLNDYTETNPLYHYLISDQLFPNSALKLKIYRYLDYSMYRLGYYNRNLTIARNHTIPLAKYLENDSMLLAIKLSKAGNFYSLGKLKTAKKIYENILSNADNNLNGLRSSLYNNLGITYYKLGKYNSFLRIQLKALKKSEIEKNYQHQFKIFNNLYLFYRRSQDLESALNYLKKSKIIAQKINNPARLGKVYISYGTFYKTFKHNFVKAQTYFKKAEKYLDPQDDAELYINLINERADTFQKQGKFQEALNKYNYVFRITQEKDQASHLTAIVNLALIQLKLGHIHKAYARIQEFKSADLSTLDFSQVVKARTVEARYKLKTNHPEEAIAILNPTIAQITQRARNSADPQTGFWHVEDEYINAFALGVSTFRQVNQPKKVIKLLEKLKTINDKSLYQSPLVRARQLNESELTSYKRLSSQLDANRKKLLTAPEDERFQIQENIDFLKSKKQKLDDKITQQAERPDVRIHNIQRQLSAHDLVMDITILKNTCYIANITRSQVSVHDVPFDSSRQKLFSGALKKLATQHTNLDSLYAITQILGLKDIPNRITRITVIPDSYFFQLPIDVLPLSKPKHPYSYGQTRYVVEKFQTRYATSLNSLGLEDREQNKETYHWNFAGYGISEFGPRRNAKLVPLPYAKSEIHSIANTLTNINDKKTFINRRSTKSSFKKVAPHARILHLATHSHVSERDPLFSTIYMSNPTGKPDSSFNSQIFAYELFELKLNNSMIMLNSCESGSGPYIQGTGITGLSRALRYAGAHSLVLNRWSVNDKLAADFATHFYAQLNKGASRAQALQDTKRYFLKTQNANPYFWGSYTLIGNAAPLIYPYHNTNMAMAKIFIIYFLAMAGLSYAANRSLLQGVFNKR